MSTDISLNQIYEIEGRSYRIVNITGNSLRLFPMNMKTLDLKEYTFEQLKENLSKEVAKLSEDPYEALRMSSPSEKIMKRADERYDQIKGLLSNPDNMFSELLPMATKNYMSSSTDSCIPSG